MKCNDLRELLSAYADGELGHAELEVVKAHLDQCDECRGVLADYLEISRQISSLRTISIEADIVTRTMAKVKTTQKRKWQPPAWQIVGASIVLIALIVGLIVGIPLMGGKTDFALAAEKIVRNSDEFKTAIAGEGNITLEQVIRRGENEATVTFSTEKGKQIVAQVDVKAKRVIELRVFGLKIEFPPNPEFDLELTEAEKAEAIAIAEGDPTVSELIAKGVEITHVWGSVIEGRKMVDIGIIPRDSQGVRIVDGIYLIDGKSVKVDLDNKKVSSLTEFGISVSVISE